MSKSDSLNFWLTETEAWRSSIRSHIELQQKTVNLGLVVLTAFTGYAFNFWNENSFDDLREGEIALVLILSPVIAQFFIWRHIEHESTLIDCADYIQGVCRPRVRDLLGDDQALDFEQYLLDRRVGRYKRFGPIWVLGAEHIVLYGYMLLYLGFSWSIRISVNDRAGEADVLFDWLLYVGSVMALITIYIGVRNVFWYRGIPARAALANAPAGSNAETIDRGESRVEERGDSQGHA